MRSGNPTLRESTFDVRAGAGEELMTLNGTVNKTIALFLMVLATASYVWWQLGDALSSGDEARTRWLHVVMFGSLIVAFAVGVVTCIKPHFSPITAPAYALFEGFAIGGISLLAESHYPGVVLHAVALTFGVFACLLLAYRSGLIKATANIKLMIVSATGGIALLYLADLAASAFLGGGFPMIHEGGWVGIAFSLVVCAVAALNLVLDFDFVESGVGRAPGHMEWYAGFGLLVTLIWLYLEILRLLMKIRSGGED